MKSFGNNDSSYPQNLGFLPIQPTQPKKKHITLSRLLAEMNVPGPIFEERDESDGYGWRVFPLINEVIDLELIARGVAALNYPGTNRTLFLLTNDKLHPSSDKRLLITLKGAVTRITLLRAWYIPDIAEVYVETFITQANTQYKELEGDTKYRLHQRYKKLRISELEKMLGATGEFSYEPRPFTDLYNILVRLEVIKP